MNPGHTSVFVVPAHGEVHHMMQLRNRDLLRH